MNIKQTLPWIFSMSLIGCSGLKTPSNKNIYNSRGSMIPESWEDIFAQSKDIDVTPVITGRVEGERTKVLNKKNPDLDKISETSKPIPVKAFLIKHPDQGDILIDTGFDTTFNASSDGNLNFFARMVVRINGFMNVQKEDESLNDLIINHNINPQMVLFTHLHHDHTAGLPALNDSIEVIADKNEINTMAKLTVSNHFKGKANLKYFDFNNSSKLFPYERIIDVFGDCSVLAISTPGHTKGHVSYFINDRNNPVFIVGDAIMYKDAQEFNIEPYSVGKKNTLMAQTSLQNIKTFMKTYPNIEFIYAHDD